MSIGPVTLDNSNNLLICVRLIQKTKHNNVVESTNLKIKFWFQLVLFNKRIHDVGLTTNISSSSWVETIIPLKLVRDG
jgi:hypothetical protein